MCENMCEADSCPVKEFGAQCPYTHEKEEEKKKGSGIEKKNGTSLDLDGYGCLSAVLFIFIIWAWLFGLPTTWGTLNIDLLPPGIYLEDKGQ